MGKKVVLEKGKAKGETMRIERRKDSEKLRLTKPKVNKEKVTAMAGLDFPDVLQEYHASPWQANLDEILDKLDKIGERLSTTFSIYDLREYKETLRKFLQESFGNVYQLKNETAWSHQGRPKIFQTLQLIDQELESLSKSVLAEQKDRLKILDKLDQIRGILIDLYS
ncbi:MAG: YaaR family protein [Peptococcia bacterium]